MPFASASQVEEPLPQGPVRRIVVPVGGTDREWLAQEQAILFADAIGVPLVGVTVTTAPDEVRADQFDFLKRQSSRRGVAFSSLVLAGTDPVDELLQELTAMDLVILGSERIGDRHQMPGFAERLLHDAPGPVQVVRVGQRD